MRLSLPQEQRRFEISGPCLGLKAEDVGRFRDAYVKDGRLVVFTRLGGGNRECDGVFTGCSGEEHSCYQPQIKALQNHPLYVEDYDDEFDSTYASFVFRIPPVPVWDAFFTDPSVQAEQTPMERFRGVIKKLESGDQSDPQVQRALEVGKRILGELEKKMKDGKGGFVEV